MSSAPAEVVRKILKEGWIFLSKRKWSRNKEHFELERHRNRKAESYIQRTSNDLTGFV